MLRARSLLRVALGLSVSALFVWLLLGKVDAGKLVDAIRDMNPWWLVAATPFYALAMWTRAQRWRLILRPAIAISASDALSLVMIGYTANNLLPARAGEIVRVLLLQRRTGASRFMVLGTIVVERVLDGLVLVLFLPLPLLLGGSDSKLNWLAVLSGAGFLAAVTVLVALAARPEPMARLIQRLIRIAPARLRPPLAAWTTSFLAGLSLLRGPKAWATVTGVTALSWACEAGFYWMVGTSFGLGISPWLYFGVAGAANIAISVPSGPGGVGVFEYFAREVLVDFGINLSRATAYALVLHALLLVPTTLIGLVLLWRDHLSIGALRAQAAAAAAEIGALPEQTLAGAEERPA